jgi:hypothetical protein
MLLEAHREAWRRVVNGPHEWVVVMEDDAVLVDSVDLTRLPAVRVPATVKTKESGL